MSLDDIPLPQGAGQQNGWEDEIGEYVGNQYYAEADDDEVDDYQRSIDAETALYLLGAQTDKQRDEYHAQQPGIFYQQIAGHNQEVLVGCQSDDGQHDGKGYYRCSHGDTRALADKRFVCGTDVVCLQQTCHPLHEAL